MSFKRATRVADLIMADISDILLREIRDPRIKLVTITGVDLTDELLAEIRTTEEPNFE
jgi:ribosome-binding factor A